MARILAGIAVALGQWQNWTMNSQQERQLLDESAHWAARLASPECTAEERKAFESWRSRSPAHARAWTMVDRVEQGFNQLATDNAELLAMADAAFADSAAPRRDYRRWLPMALAASVAAVGMFVTAVTVLRPSAGVSMYASADAADGRRSLTLDDGSTIELDVNSAIEVEMTAAERRVVLLRGRALFQVAHDSARPFSVVAGAGRTVALGTRFQVDHHNDSVAVTLTEGSVSVTGLGNLDGQAELLQPGEQLSYAVEPRAWSKQVVDVQAVTGWERGRLVFHGTPLSEALAEVNRYVDRPIRLDDQSLAVLPVSGNFIAGDSDLVVSALLQTLPISADERGGEILLRSRSN